MEGQASPWHAPPADYKLLQVVREGWTERQHRDINNGRTGTSSEHKINRGGSLPGKTCANMTLRHSAHNNMLAGSAYLEHQDQVLEMLLKFPRFGTHVMTRHELLYPCGSYRHVHVHIYLLFRLLSCWQTLAHRVFSNLSCDWSCKASSGVLIWLMSTPAEFTLPSTASWRGISSVKSCAHNTDTVDYYWFIIYWFQVKIIDRDPGGILRFPTVSLTLFNNKRSNLPLIYRLYLCSYIFSKRKSSVCVFYPEVLSVCSWVTLGQFQSPLSIVQPLLKLLLIRNKLLPLGVTILPTPWHAHRKMFIYNCAQCLKYACKHTHIIPRVHIKHTQRQAFVQKRTHVQDSQYTGNHPYFSLSW